MAGHEASWDSSGRPGRPSGWGSATSDGERLTQQVYWLGFLRLPLVWKVFHPGRNPMVFCISTFFPFGIHTVRQPSVVSLYNRLHTARQPSAVSWYNKLHTVRQPSAVSLYNRLQHQLHVSNRYINSTLKTYLPAVTWLKGGQDHVTFNISN